MLDGCFYFILIKSWIWLFKMWWNTMKYSVMCLVSIFVGPGKTIHKLALSNTFRRIGYFDQGIYDIEKAKVIGWMVWAGLYWIATIALMTVGYYVNGVK